jgi:hypothetical protein
MRRNLSKKEVQGQYVEFVMIAVRQFEAPPFAFAAAGQ